MPTGLAARLNVEVLVNQTRRVVNSPDDDGEPPGKQKLKVAVVPHFEAGSYGCGFIYYESLATCRERGYETKVVFSHIPGWRDPERLERGADVISAVIGAVCQQINPVSYN